jgi:hypothetical protein
MSLSDLASIASFVSALAVAGSLILFLKNLSGRLGIVLPDFWFQLTAN